MDLATLRTEAQRLSGRVDQDFNSRTRRWLNEALEEWAIAVPWPTLEVEEDFAAAGTAQLILPQRVKQVNWLGDKTNRRYLGPSRHFDREAPESFLGSTQGAAVLWRPHGVQAVSQQPAVIGALSVRTDASDVFSVYVEGLAEETALSGTANQYYVMRERIQVSSSGVHSGTKLFKEVHTLGKDDFTAGDVVVRDSSSNIISRIAAHNFRSEYRRVDLLNIPPAGTLIRVNYLRSPLPLVDDWNVLHTSVDSEYCIWYAAAMSHEAQGQAELAAVKFARAKEILERRIYKERSHGDQDYRALPEPSYWQHDDWDIPHMGHVPYGG